MNLASCLISFFVVYFASLCTCCAQQGNYSHPSIERLNLTFRELYATARQERLEGTGPIVIVQGDSLVLLTKGGRKQGETRGPNYHDLKTVAHVPLAVFCVVGSRLDEELGEESAAQLRELRDLVLEVIPNLPQAFRAPEIRERQRLMLRRCMAFVDSVLDTQRCSAKELDEFIDELRPLILQNVEEATKLTIDNYHKQMCAWRSKMTNKEWSEMYVVIPGSSLARKDFVAVQYFAKLLGERGEGRRIIFAESRWDESQELQLLGTHILDTEVGVAFFNDPWRMQRDLLASAADSYLDSLDFE